MTTGCGKLLCFITFVVVLACIIMAACISTILPNYVTEPGYYQENNLTHHFNEAVEMCNCIASVYPDGTKKRITFTKVSQSQEYYDRVKRQSWTKPISHKFLVSLSTPAYNDDRKHLIFVCNGVIISKNQILTSKSCVTEESEWFDIIVRAGSPFWSAMGKVYTVKNHSSYADSFVKITVNGIFSPSLVNSALAYQKRVDQFSHPLRHALTIIGWDGLMYEKSLEYRNKFTEYEILNWTSTKCFNVESKVCFDSEKANCNKMSSRVLVASSNKLLLGMQVDGPSEALKFMSTVQDANQCFSVFEDSCKERQVNAVNLQ